MQIQTIYKSTGWKGIYKKLNLHFKHYFIMSAYFARIQFFCRL